uniref:Secreted protein n=1 Tax=Setaria italica TaxID=4555 RepID=K4ANG7_SETIT
MWPSLHHMVLVVVGSQTCFSILHQSCWGPLWDLATLKNPRPQKEFAAFELAFYFAKTFRVMDKFFFMTCISPIQDFY